MDRDLKKATHTHFTTGEFAKLCKVTKQTLFHYDQVGIFSPEIKGENDYRYYSYNQLEVFAVISMLKEMEMPLKDIKRYLDYRSPQALIHLLAEQEIEIEKKMEELEWLREFVKTKSKITTFGMHAIPGMVIIETLEEDYMILTSYSGSSEDKDVSAGIIKHLNFCHSQDIYSAYSIGCMLSTENIPINDDYGYSHFYTRLSKDDYNYYYHLPNEEKSIITTKPAGKYASICHKGGYASIHTDYLKLAEYVKTHGLTMGSYFYEDAILDELSMKGYDNYLLKLSVRVW